MSTGADPADRGLLLPEESRQAYRLVRLDPPADLARHVAFVWLLEWDLRGAPPRTTGVLPFPAVNLTLETARPSRVTGVSTGRYDYTLEGAGRVLGARFRPGGFACLLDGPVVSLTGREVPVPDVFPGVDADALARDAAGRPDDDAAAVLVTLLRLRLPAGAPDPVLDLVNHLVDDVAVRPDVTRVEQLAAHAGTSVRGLQRMFRAHVGVSPKWVLLRHRLHDATQALHPGQPLDVAALAAQLGYADQAHLTRDVRSVVGMTPAAYSARRAAATMAR
ncbi:helix-turn-helix domain-containing protein [Rhodococcus aerolatus]